MFLEGSRAPQKAPGKLRGPPEGAWKIPEAPVGFQAGSNARGMRLEGSRARPEGPWLVPGECHLSKLVIYNLNLPGGRAKRPEEEAVEDQEAEGEGGEKEAEMTSLGPSAYGVSFFVGLSCAGPPPRPPHTVNLLSG